MVVASPAQLSASYTQSDSWPRQTLSTLCTTAYSYTSHTSSNKNIVLFFIFINKFYIQHSCISPLLSLSIINASSGSVINWEPVVFVWQSWCCCYPYSGRTAGHACSIVITPVGPAITCPYITLSSLVFYLPPLSNPFIGSYLCEYLLSPDRIIIQWSNIIPRREEEPVYFLKIFV